MNVFPILEAYIPFYLDTLDVDKVILGGRSKNGSPNFEQRYSPFLSCEEFLSERVLLKVIHANLHFFDG